MTLNHQQFERIRRLALELAGIELFERHRDVVDRRSRRFGIADEDEIEALLDAVDDGDARASRRLIGLLTTNFTSFFRHPHHFDLAAEHALWAVHRRGTARLWSAAAATGEEPYSLAMASIDVFQRDDPAVTILATDIDDDALEIARRGEYGEPALNALPYGHRTRFFSRAADTGRWRIAQAARDLVAFRTLNLTDVDWHLAGPFDVVFCRNVLLYLEAGHRYAVLERIVSLLALDGVLFLDPAEHLGGAGHLFVKHADGVYARRPPLHRRSEPRAAAASRDEVGLTMTIARRLIILVAVPLLILVGLSVIIQSYLRDIEARSRFVAETQIGSLALLGDISRSYTEMRVNVRAYVEADDQAGRDRARGAL